VAAKPRSAKVGRPVTLTARVKVRGRSRVVPAGDVTFLDGTTVLGTIPLDRGKATLRIASLPLGPDPIRAEYTGGGGFPGGSAGPIVVTIRAARSRPKVLHR
jgi:hypothetical protein